MNNVPNMTYILFALTQQQHFLKCDLCVQATAAPFINAIYDREPLTQWAWGRVMLIGESAHPTTPHGLRSTNMAILDAAALGEAMENCEGEIEVALQEYQSSRIPVTAHEVCLCSSTCGACPYLSLTRPALCLAPESETEIEEVP